MRIVSFPLMMVSLLCSVPALSQSEPPKDSGKVEIDVKKLEQGPLFKWLQKGGDEQLRTQGVGRTEPAWKSEAFGEVCLENPNAKPTDAPKKCGPKPPDPTPFTPCGSTSSCGPGVGMDSGVITKERAELLNPVLLEQTRR